MNRVKYFLHFVMRHFMKYILYKLFFIILSVRLLFHEVLWLCRLQFVKHFLKNHLLGHVLSELRTRGVCVLPGYYTTSLMEMIRTECWRELDILSPEFGRLKGGLEGVLPLEDGVSIERYSGSIKIKNPNNSLLNLIRG